MHGHVRPVLLTALCTLITVAFCLCAAAGLLICGKCGYENPDGSRFCNHCGNDMNTAAQVAEVKADPASSQVARPVAEHIDRIDTAIVDRELETSVEYMKKHRPWMALLFCENAMALNGIATPDTTRAERILKLHTECEGAMLGTDQRCGACGGTGVAEAGMKSISTTGSVSTQSVSSRICVVCGGRGTMQGKAGSMQMAYAFGQAQKEYILLRQGHAWVPVGEAWIPQELDGRLDFRQIAALKRAVSARCGSCLGLGKSACSRCNGTGSVKCPVDGCIGGQVESKVEGGLTSTRKSKSGDKKKEVSLRIKCERCEGMGAVRCGQCGGGGTVMCPSCQGSGRRPACTKCDGEGIKLCSRCVGSGSNRGKACEACRACGAILCSECHGDGKSRR